MTTTINTTKPTSSLSSTSQTESKQMKGIKEERDKVSQTFLASNNLHNGEEFLLKSSHYEGANEDGDEEQEKDEVLVKECNNLECLEYGEISPEFDIIEKSVIIHRDQNGFGLRVKGQSPVFIEHVHENGAAWKVGVRKLDRICKVNGTNVFNSDHKDVVLMFKNCTRFVCLTLFSNGPMERVSEFISKSIDTSKLVTNASYQQRLIRNVLPQTELHLTTMRQAQDESFNPEFKGSILNSDIKEQHIPSDISTSSVTSFNNQNRQHQIPKKLTTNQHLINSIHHHRQLCSRSLYFTSSIRDNNNSSTPILFPPSLPETPEVSVNKTTTGRGQMRNPFIRMQQHLSSSPLGARRTGSVIARPVVNNHNHEMTAISHKKTCLRNRANSSSIKNDCNCFESQQTVGSQASLHRQQQQQQQHLRSQDERNNINQQVEIKINSSIQEKKPQEMNSSLELQKQPSLKVNKRVEIIKEFIDTEKTHTDRLKCLDELFYKPLKSGNLITSEELKMVFSCHRNLYKLHKQIYRTLISANYNIYSEPMIGSALIEIFEGDIKRRLERAACLFCVAQSTNVELLNKLTRRDTKVGDFLAHVTSQQMIGRLGIKDLLASCFQRLTKYPLLLENLLKATPTSPPEASPRNKFTSTNSNHKRPHLSSSSENNNVENFDENEPDEEEEEEEDESQKNSRRMMAISLAEEREFIERALYQSRQILIKVNDSVKNALARNKLREIWKKTEKYPGVPLIDITRQQVIHEGPLTLRLAKRSFEVFVLLLNDYIIILTREGQDKFRLKFFTPEGKSNQSNLILSPPIISSSTNSNLNTNVPGSSSEHQQQFNYSTGNTMTKSGQLLSTFPTINLQQQQQPQSPQVYSPIFMIDEHLTTRDAATDENGFYLLCKRRDDSRIYEFASRSPAERMKWRDKIQLTIERQMNKQLSMSLSSTNTINNDNNYNSRRQSCESTITRSSSDISSIKQDEQQQVSIPIKFNTNNDNNNKQTEVDNHKQVKEEGGEGKKLNSPTRQEESSRQESSSDSKNCPTKIEGSISYVEDDGIVMPSKMETSKAFVDQAIQVNIFDNLRKPLIT